MLHIFNILAAYAACRQKSSLARKRVFRDIVADRDSASSPHVTQRVCCEVGGTSVDDKETEEVQRDDSAAKNLILCVKEKKTGTEIWGESRL
nr:hypothetical protein CFP56_21258 [Quercus suber]